MRRQDYLLSKFTDLYYKYSPKMKQNILLHSALVKLKFLTNLLKLTNLGLNLGFGKWQIKEGSVEKFSQISRINPLTVDENAF